MAVKWFYLDYCAPFHMSGIAEDRNVKHGLHEVKKVHIISYQFICITAKNRKCNTRGSIILFKNI